MSSGWKCQNGHLWAGPPPGEPPICPECGASGWSAATAIIHPETTKALADDVPYALEVAEGVPLPPSVLPAKPAERVSAGMPTARAADPVRPPPFPATHQPPAYDEARRRPAPRPYDRPTSSSLPLILGLTVGIALLIFLLVGGLLLWKWHENRELQAEAAMQRAEMARALAAEALARQAADQARQMAEDQARQAEEARQRDIDRAEAAARAKKAEEEEAARELGRRKKEEEDNRLWRKQQARLALDKYYQQIQDVEKRAQAGNAKSAWEELNRCDQEFRGWEWHHLYRKLRGGLVVARAEWAPSAAFSPDGQRLALAWNQGDQQGYVKVLDLKTGRDLHFFRANDKKMSLVAFHPDGNRLATLSLPYHFEERAHYGAARVWDLTTGKDLFTLSEAGEKVRHLTFSPDGRWLATHHQGKMVKTWHADTGKPGREFPHPDEVLCLVFSPDGNLLATGCKDKLLRFWDIATGQQTFVFKDHADAVINLAFLPGGKEIASMDWSWTVKVWEWPGGKVLRSFQEDQNSQQAMARFSKDGRRLAVVGRRDGVLKLWDLAEGRRLFDLPQRPSFYDLHFSPDGQRLVSSVATEGELRIWDVGDTPATGVVCQAPGEFLLRLAHSADGRLAVAGWKRLVKIFDGNTHQELVTLTGHQGHVGALAFSKDGKLLATGGDDHLVKLWDAASGKELRTLRNHTAPLRDLAFSPDGKTLVTAARGFIGGNLRREIKFWSLETGLETQSVTNRLGDDLKAIAFNPENSHLAVAAGRHLEVWDGAGQAAVWTSPRIDDGFLQSVAYSPDGWFLAGALFEGKVILWQANGTELLRIDTGARVNWVSFTRDNRRLVTCGTDGLVKFWDVATGRQVLTLRGHRVDNSGVRDAAFSPSGSRLATVSSAGGGEVRFWDAAFPPRGQREIPELFPKR